MRLRRATTTASPGGGAVACYWGSRNRVTRSVVIASPPAGGRRNLTPGARLVRLWRVNFGPRPGRLSAKHCEQHHKVLVGFYSVDESGRHVV